MKLKSLFAINRSRYSVLICLQFTSIPDDYDDVHQNLSRRGARVLALGFRSLGTLTPEKVWSSLIRNLAFFVE